MLDAARAANESWQQAHLWALRSPRSTPLFASAPAFAARAAPQSSSPFDDNARSPPSAARRAKGYVEDIDEGDTGDDAHNHKNTLSSDEAAIANAAAIVLQSRVRGALARAHYQGALQTFGLDVLLCF